MIHQPHEFDQALRLKASDGDAITAIAGGTDLIVALNRNQWRPQAILDLTRIQGNADITRQNGTCRVAAGATHAQLSALPVEVLAKAALSIGGPQIRNRGTIGGNLGTASPAGDGCVALLALDADVELSHAARGTRRIPVRDYFLDYRRTALQPDELIRAVYIPTNWQTAWYKIGKRASVNISVICCAIGRSPEGRFCVAFGCTGPYPMRATATERLLSGKALTAALIDEAAATAMSEVSPIDDHRASAAYRRAMCGVVLKRLLTEKFMRSTPE